MKKEICIINGPNLNLLGKRNIEVYGQQNFEDFFKDLETQFSEDTNLIYFQSNSEGELIDFIHKMGFSGDGIILNAGGYSHTSIAIRDAIEAIDSPCVEVHISNIYAREEFRHKSVLTPVCKGSIVGFGLQSYTLAIHSLIG